MATQLLKAAVLGILFGAILSTPAIAKIDPGGFDYYEDALMRFYKEDYNSAVIQLKSAIQQQPKHLPSHILLGKTYLELKDGPAAEAEFELARGLGADSELILVPLGRAYMLQGKYQRILREIQSSGQQPRVAAEIKILHGDAHLALKSYDDAEKAYKAATALHPDNADAVIGRSQVHISQGKLENAENFIDIATVLAPDNAEAWFIKGEMRRLQQDLSGALQYYDKAIEIDPGDFSSRISRAATLIDMKRFKEAYQDIEYIRELDPEHPQAAYLYAILLVEQKDVIGAKAALQAAAGRLAGFEKSGHPPSILQLGVINFAQGNFEAAESMLNHYVKIDSQHMGARKLLGQIYVQKGKGRYAINILKPALEVLPNDAQLIVLLGNAYVLDKQYDRAIELLEKAVQLTPDHATLRTQLAISRLASGKRTQAITDLESVLADEAEASHAGLILARIYLEQGNHPAAMALGDQLIQAMPDDPVGYNVAGVTHMNKNNMAQARRSFEQALQRDQRYIPALLNLASLDFQDKNIYSARGRYQAILDIDVKNIKAMTGLAEIAYSSGRRDDAIAWYEKIRAVDRNAIAQQLQLIELYFQQKKPDVALQVAEDLESSHPDNLPAIFAQGRANLDLGNRDRAIVLYKSLSRMNTDSAAHLHGVAKFQIVANDLAGARYTLDQAINADTTYIPAHITRTALELRTGDLDRAMQYAKEALRANPDSYAGDMLTGDVYVRMQRYKDAIAAYKRAQRREQNSQITVRMYHARELAGEGKEALKMLEQWVAAHPDNKMAVLALAGAYLNAGQLEIARDHHERLLREDGTNADLLNNLAWIYNEMGDQRALSLAERAYKLAPKQASTLDTYGWILVQKGRYTKGLQYLREAQSRAANDPRIHYHLGVALHHLGRTREARKELKLALETDPEFDNATQALNLLDQLK